MRRSIWVIVSFLLLVAAASATARVDADESAPLSPDANLLTNPSFEGNYVHYSGHPDCGFGVCQTVLMAPGWTPYWRSNTGPSDPYAMPEYKEATLNVPPPPRVRDGASAQQYFTFSKLHEAGIYQQVSVTPGADYCFTIWGHSWSSSDDDPRTSDSQLEQRIGLDPTGGTDWQSASIDWGNWKQQYNKYGLFSWTAQAQSDTMTVFTYSRPVWPVKHNDVYWDDAALRQLTVTPTLAVTPTALMFVSPPGVTQTLSKTLQLDVGGDANGIWTAEQLAIGDLALQLSAVEGTGDGSVVIGVDTSGYAAGTYTAYVRVVRSCMSPANVVDVPVTLVVVDMSHAAYLPLAIGPP